MSYVTNVSPIHGPWPLTINLTIMSDMYLDLSWTCHFFRWYKIVLSTNIINWFVF
jgi:hypothetical protein